MKDSKWYKRALGGVGALIAGIALMLGTTVFVYPAISQLVGLAVAQTSSLWNNVKDAAVGDAISNGILAQSVYLFNGTTFDRIRGTSGSMNVNLVGAITPADAYANPTTASQVWNLNGVFNGTTWDRVRTATADALASTGIQAINSVVFNGSTFDRLDGVSATNNTATTSVGVVQVAPLSTWSSINTTSAAATAATISKAAGGGSVRHVATGITACFFDTAANTAVRLVNLRDGATGAGTILRTWFFSGPVASSVQCENVTGLNMTGSANTAMTLEFAAAPAATASETVTITGYSTP